MYMRTHMLLILLAANLSTEGDTSMTVECCPVGPCWHLQSFYSVAISCLKIKQKIYDIGYHYKISIHVELMHVSKILVPIA